MLQVPMTCVECGKVQVISVRTVDYNAWCDGMLIQDAMPYLDDDERELLISGICGPCFDEFFGEDEDDD